LVPLGVNHYQRYLQKDTSELVKVIETPEDYQPEVIKIAKEILEDRKLPQEELHSMAAELQRDRIIKMLNNLDPINDELIAPQSFFLSPEEIKTMLQEEFAQFIKDKEGFRFDVWKYSIGGI